MGEYIVKKAKPYSSGYYSLSGVDIKNFGVPHFTEKEKNILLDLKDEKKLISGYLNFIECLKNTTLETQ